MKKIPNLTTTMNESQTRHGGNPEVKLTYTDLMEICLDIVPQGGFTPKDIRERNRIQESIDEYKKKIKDTHLKKTESKEIQIEFEDADYKAFVQIIKLSRWMVRNKDLQAFLSFFDKGED